MHFLQFLKKDPFQRENAENGKKNEENKLDWNPGHMQNRVQPSNKIGLNLNFEHYPLFIWTYAGIVSMLFTC